MMTVKERYAHYFTNGKNRRQSTSLRLAGCELLVAIVSNRAPCRVLDLGSGITSHMLRAIPGAEVTTTDLSEEWLEVTVQELHRDGLSAARCFPQDLFEKGMQNAEFDVVCVDSGNLDYRVRIIDQIVRWCAPNGIIVLDDFGMREYADLMGNALTARGFRVKAHMETYDEYGTYIATAERV